MRTAICQPIFVFGMQHDSLHIAAGPEDAVRHAVSHAGDALDRFEFFDAHGRPLAPVRTASGEFELLDPQLALELRVRSVLVRCQPHLATSGAPAELKEMLQAYLDEKVPFGDLVARLAKLRAEHPHPHSGSGLHDLCHRLHLC